MHAVFIVPILVVAALGRATLAWWRFCGSLHTYNVRKGAIGRNLPPAPASGTRRQKSGCGATAELTTTIFRSPPASTTLSTLRRRRVSGSRPPRPVCSARRAEARRRNSAFDFRPRRDGATRASVGISNFLLLI